ncbi:restriction endonuclease subunit S [uncultured Faecalibacterium sp.]|uniref:restriction endonuclease subunit S n=1 Tax=uncultured Faecalibacterium sp. TaxID=259315 RepID=UPI002805DFBB|nr:restriction endonuclease subunit S [uncultured Faecalibacterium sp.]
MKWEYKTLDQLGTVSRGKSKHRPRNDPKLFGGKYPFIQTADVKNADYYITKYSDTYNESGLAQSKLWDKGTLCITIAANIADTGVLAFPACFPDSIMGFVPFEGVANTRFIKYCFDRLQRDCKQISQGTAQDNLSWEKLSTIKFCIPEYKEQCRIADILSAYDDLIENNQKQIKLLEEAAQRLYKEWFLDLRFPGHENTKIVDGVPEGWSRGLLKELISVNYGKDHKKAPDDGNIPVYGSGGLMRKCNKSLFSGEAVLIPRKGSLNNIMYVDETFWTVDTMFYATMKQPHTAVFVYFFVKAFDMYSMNIGAAVPSMTTKILDAMDVVIPDKETLEKFDKLTKTYFNKIKTLQGQNERLKTARNLLLPKLMSGEVEV